MVDEIMLCMNKLEKLELRIKEKKKREAEKKEK